MDDEEPRVWAVMTPEEGAFEVTADRMAVAPNGDRFIYDGEDQIVGVYPPGFAVWLCPDEEDDDG